MSQTKAQLLDNIKDNVQLDAQKALRFADSDSSHYVAFRAPGTVSSSVTWTLPAADGSANYVLATDGSGTLSWIADPAGQWVTSGSNIYFTGGNVGIGDNSPSNPLSVTGASAFNGDVQFTGASYNVTWDKSADDLIFDDNAKAIFGTSSDGLEIYHDGSTSTIKDSGTGNLNFQGSHFDFINAAGNEYSARLYNDGEVQLYFNGNEKLNTVTDGINLTGSLQFADDTNTHLAHPASDVLAITTAGSERLRVDASGNVGIGTNSPSSLLHIVGGTGANVLINAATHDASTANQARLQLGFVHSGGQALAHLKLDEAANNSFDGLLKIGVPYNNGSGGSTTREVIEADFNGNICLPGSTVTWDTTARTNGLQLYYETDAGVATIGSYSSGGSTALTFATNNGGGAAAERMRITSTGRVLIGDNAATSLLSVGGSNANWDEGDVPMLLIEGYNNEAPTSGSHNIAFQIKDENANLIHKVWNAGGGNSDVGNVYYAGKVGLGTTSPDTKLHLSGTNDAVIRLESTDTGLGQDELVGGIEFEKNDSSGAGAGIAGGIRCRSDDSYGARTYLAFSTRENSTGAAATDTEQFRILSQGGVTFNGDTGSAGSLNDWEQGTFTPTITGGVSNPSYTASTASGEYTKIGNICHIQILIIVTDVSSQGSGNWRIAGMPFNSGGAAYSPMGIVGYNDIFATAIYKCYLTGTTLMIVPDGVTQSNQTYAQNAFSTGYFSVTMTYKTT